MPASANRLVSLHDPDARPITKGRLGKPVEFGYKGQVIDNVDGIVLDCDLHPGNPPDAPLRLGPHPVRHPARRADMCGLGVLAHNIVKIAHLIHANQPQPTPRVRPGQARPVPTSAPDPVATRPPPDPLFNTAA
jgi:hypothetical protein